MTAAQQAAHDKAYAECDHTIEGRFSKGDVVADHRGNCWKIVTYGIRYHDDVSSCIYGVQPCRGPKGAKETQEIRAAIEHVLGNGTHEPGSRGGIRRNDAGEYVSVEQPRPAGAPLISWTDKSSSAPLASKPTITLYEGHVVGVVRPIYDDSPSVAWMQDDKLERRLWKLINACPKPVTLPEVHVKERYINLTIDAISPRYAAYASARNAEVIAPTDYGIKAGLKLPRSEYRRITAELDGAAVPTDAS